MGPIQYDFQTFKEIQHSFIFMIKSIEVLKVYGNYLLR
jgi:hypothetical protein